MSLADGGKLLIITNWFRKVCESNISIDDICKVIIEFAKMYEQFDGYDKAGVAITNNGTIATVHQFTHSGWPIYCKNIIPDEAKQTFTWKIRCCKIGMYKYWGIGFDAVENNQFINIIFIIKLERTIIYISQIKISGHVAFDWINN